MAWWRAFRFGFKRLVRPAAADIDLEDEVRDYLARLTADYEQAGLSPDEAARRARVELGSVTAVKDHVRQGTWEAVVETTWRDVRLAGRRLRHEPGFTVVAATTLALGIGAATAIFSALNPILLAPLPYPHADRLVMVSVPGSHGQPSQVNYLTFLELSARSAAFEHLAVADSWQPALIDDAAPERLVGERVSAGYFRTLGVAPAIGRDFNPSEDRPGAPRVAIVSDGLARRHFGSAAGLRGRTLKLDGDEWQIIGVLPPDFDNVVGYAVEVWAPRQYRSPATTAGPEAGNHLTMIGRLKPAFSIEGARADLAALAAHPTPQFVRAPWADLSTGLMLRPLQDSLTQPVRSTLLALVGAVGLVLAIACANVTNLLLARLARRRGEFAMRAALGAGRARLVRQLVTESVVLAALGGGLGLLVAEIGVRALVALSPPDLPRLSAVAVDGTVFLFALAITGLVGLVVGLAPAVATARRPTVAQLDLASGRLTGRRLGRRLLVVAEVSLAVVLLIGAGLLWRSLTTLFAEPAGFEPSHVLTMTVQTAGHRYDADPVRLQFFREALDAVRAVPGVSAAAFTSQLPLDGEPPEQYGAQYAEVANDWDDGALRYAVTPDYFAVMRIPLRQGRLLDGSDVPGRPKAVVLSETYARRLFGKQDPIGQHVRFGPEMAQTNGPWDEVVGVVGDVKQTSLTLGPPEGFYVASGQWPWVDGVQSLVVRTTLTPATLASAVKSAIWSVDKHQPIVRVTTMASLVARSETERTFALMVFEIFAIVAVVLAAIGLYGVLAGSVAERTREIGIRVALGAPRLQILGKVVGEGLSLTGVGLALGLTGAVVAAPILASLVFGISLRDPLTFLVATGSFVAVALTACAVPAGRAVRVDAVTALRE